MQALSKNLSDYLSLKSTIAELEKQKDELEAAIKEAMGDQEEIMVDGHTIRWKTVLTSRFDSTAFKERHEALYRQFIRQGESKRFTVT